MHSWATQNHSNWKDKGGNGWLKEIRLTSPPVYEYESDFAGRLGGIFCCEKEGSDCRRRHAGFFLRAKQLLDNQIKKSRERPSTCTAWRGGHWKLW